MVRVSDLSDVWQLAQYCCNISFVVIFYLFKIMLSILHMDFLVLHNLNNKCVRILMLAKFRVKNFSCNFII